MAYVEIDNHKMHVFAAGEQGPFILLPHPMAGLEAIRWKQKYPDEIKAVIGLDMAFPGLYLRWKP